MIPAEVDHYADMTAALEAAAARVRRGFLTNEQRDALAALLLLAGTATLPTPIVAVLRYAITTFTQPVVTPASS